MSNIAFKSLTFLIWINSDHWVSLFKNRLFWLLKRKTLCSFLFSLNSELLYSVSGTNKVALLVGSFVVNNSLTFVDCWKWRISAVAVMISLNIFASSKVNSSTFLEKFFNYLDFVPDFYSWFYVNTTLFKLNNALLLLNL